MGFLVLGLSAHLVDNHTDNNQKNNRAMKNLTFIEHFLHIGYMLDIVTHWHVILKSLSIPHMYTIHYGYMHLQFPTLTFLGLCQKALSIFFF